MIDLQMIAMTGLAIAKTTMAAIRKDFAEGKIIILTSGAGNVEGAKKAIQGE